MPTSFTTKELIGDWRGITIQTKEDEIKNMKYLYQIYIVEKNTRVIHTLNPVIAGNEEEAKFEAGVYDKLKYELSCSLSHVNVIVKNLGAVEVE